MDSHYLDGNIPRHPALVAKVSIDTDLSWTFGLQNHLLSKIATELSIPHNHTWKQYGIKFPQAGLVAQLDTK